VTITAAADGSALGNPGPAGWAWYVDDARWAAGGWPRGTNNQGELMAVIDLFESTAHVADEDLHVLCDSQYVINAVTKWMPGWKRKGWRKADGSPVLNLELLQRLDAAIAGRRYAFEWVKGHAGHELNEAADDRARAAATAYQNHSAVPTGPGWPGRQAAPVSIGVAGAAPAVAVRTPTSSSLQTSVLELDIFASDAGAASEAAISGRELPAQRPLSTGKVTGGVEGGDAAAAAVLERERQLLDPAVRADPARVAALLHPSFQEVGASGRLFDRDSALRGLAARSAAPRAEFQLLGADRLAPDAVLVTYRLGTGEGASLRSSLWLHVGGGRWLLRYHQGTPTS
jgi:ribonuclease HI